MDTSTLILAIPGFIIALVFHEFAHAAMAYAFGDPTARRLGRMTLDPRAHLDAFGVIMLLLTWFGSGGRQVFGWAKPVPVNFYRLRPRVLGEVLVALAGILMNILLAAIFVVLAALAARSPWPWLSNPHMVTALRFVAIINTGLAIFNFLPVPPLDGWRVAVRIIPGFYGSRAANFLEQFGMFFLLLLVTLPFGRSLLGLLLTPFEWLVRQAVGLLVALLALPLG